MRTCHTDTNSQFTDILYIVLLQDPGPITLGFMEDMGWSICAGALSVDEFRASNVQISPNPFKSSITIQLENNQNDAYRIDLIDVKGRVVFTDNQAISNNSFTLNNLQKMEDALYFLKITNKESGASITKKIIKN